MEEQDWPVFSFHTSVTGESTIKIVLLVISIVIFISGGLAVFTPSLAYTTIFVFPAEVFLCFSFFTAAWTNLFQWKTVPPGKIFK